MKFNADLVGDLARQKVILFLGAGISASARTASGGKMRGWPEFLGWVNNKNLTGKIKRQIKDLIKEKDYLLACEILQQELKNEWPDLIRNEYGQVAAPSELHKSVIRLQQRLIITTNFDKLIENTCSSEALGSHYPTVLYKVDENSFRMMKDHETSYILKLHGTVDDANSLVFSRSEYIRQAFGNSQYSGLLDSLLLNYTFLYIGFSMDDPAITSLMEMYALKYPSARPHFIFTGNSVEPNISEINKRLRKLMIIPYNSSNNHEMLPGIIDSLASEASQKRREIAASLKGISIF